MAWNYARFVDRVAEAGKAEYPIPMFVNAALYGIGRGPQPPPSGGRPLDVVMDVWKAGAPHIDMLSPDAYGDFVEFCARYTRPENPLFIPKTRGYPPIGLDARALYAFGRFGAIGFSPMGIERPTAPLGDLIAVYDVLAQLAPLISEHQGDGTMSAVVLGPNDPPQKVQVGNYTLEARFMKLSPMRGAPPPQDPPSVAAIFIATGPDEYYAVGNGVSVMFTPNTPGPPLAAPATVEEGTFVNGRWVPGRRLAGDDTDGRGVVLQRLRMPEPHPDMLGPTTAGIQRVTLYRYR